MSDKKTRWRQGYDAGYDAAMREMRRCRATSGARLEADLMGESDIRGIEEIVGEELDYEELLEIAHTLENCAPAPPVCSVPIRVRVTDTRAGLPHCPNRQTPA